MSRETKTCSQLLQETMLQKGIDAFLVAHPVHLLYLTEHLFDGYFYLPARGEGVSFVRRRSDHELAGTVSIKSPAQIPQALADGGLPAPKRIALEDGELTFEEYTRLAALFPDAEIVGGSAMIKQQRMVKTSREVQWLREGAAAHDAIHAIIPSLYVEGMTDWEFAAAIEHRGKLMGQLGIMRCAGMRMETVSSIVLSGDNACSPSPYDYALGGRGRHPSVPVGPDGHVMRRGGTVMVDFCGNIGGYLTDLTRTYALGSVSAEAQHTHEIARQVLREMERLALPGALCCDLYAHAIELVDRAGCLPWFMGHTQQAKFIGHGIGLQVNEWPVLTKNDRTPLQEGMILAIEPKFTCPGVGPTGLENTYLVTDTGLEKLTCCSEEIVVIA